MKFDTNTPRANFGLGEATFTIPQPFAEGHVVTTNEAAALNQLLVENTRNNLAARAKKVDKDGKPVETITQEVVDKYVSEYEFGVRRAGGTTDPVEREARSMALVLVKQALAKKNVTLKDVSKEQMEAYVDSAMAKRGEELMKKAAAVVKARQSVAGAEADVLDLD